MVKQEEQKENTDEEQLQTNEIQADLMYVVKICVELFTSFISLIAINHVMFTFILTSICTGYQLINSPTQL